MTPDERKLLLDINEKLNHLIDIYYRINFIDKMVLTKPLVLNNTDIIIEGTKGLNIGKNTTDKIGFYGESPVTQPTAVTSPSGGTTIDSESRTAINSLITKLQSLGLLA